MQEAYIIGSVPSIALVRPLPLTDIVWSTTLFNTSTQLVFPLGVIIAVLVGHRLATKVFIG
jgi:hypothetical protein